MLLCSAWQSLPHSDRMYVLLCSEAIEGEGLGELSPVLEIPDFLDDGPAQPTVGLWAPRHALAILCIICTGALAPCPCCLQHTMCAILDICAKSVASQHPAAKQLCLLLKQGAPSCMLPGMHGCVSCFCIQH